ncbi:MAG: phospho-N-acetylmuramoyl-pentapeptide-transferase [Oscillospiraceae bacterium]|nr:phospho-N-acetylmuramoyl-pentapeptide-transferase [Oscillospiraceae bacterium]
MVEIAFSFAGAFLATVLSGVVLLPVLRRLKLGQSIREEGPKWHSSKAGTPTMGGLMFIFGIALVVVTVGWPLMMRGDYSHLMILGFAGVCGVIGLLDDLAKVRKQRNMGLTALQKLALQMAAAAAFIAFLRYFGHLTTDIYIPFTGVTLRLNAVVYMVLALPVVVGIVNAVNLTDGVDGLCTSVTLPIAAAFTAFAYLWEKEGMSLTAAALAGAMMGFLLYNFHPAKVFMGDTGALFLGGALCGLAFASGTPLILLVMGAVFVFEMFSDILQVSYFKITKGKRMFKMAPFHHHLEMIGWSEPVIAGVAAAVTIALCWLGWLGVANLPRT